MFVKPQLTSTYHITNYVPYSFCTLSCTFSGSCGKLVRPADIQLTNLVSHPLHPTGHVCAADICKPASSTSSTEGNTDQPHPAREVVGQKTHNHTAHSYLCVLSLHTHHHEIQYIILPMLPQIYKGKTFQTCTKM